MTANLRTIEAPPCADWILVDDLGELDRLRNEWKRWALGRVSTLVVQVLHEEGVPRDRIAAIAEPSVAKLYTQLAQAADSAAAAIERDILGAAMH